MSLEIKLYNCLHLGKYRTRRVRNAKNKTYFEKSGAFARDISAELSRQQLFVKLTKYALHVGYNIFTIFGALLFTYL